MARISVASQSQAARFAEGWFKQYRPGTSFVDRERVAALAIARLVEETPLDQQIQEALEPGSDTWVGGFLSVRREVGEEISQRVADINLVRSGYRLEKANWVQRGVGHLIVPSTIGVMGYLAVKIARLPIGDYKYPALLGGAWVAYEMIAKAVRTRAELIYCARRVIPEK
jgi:hypothetical protein